MMVIVLPDESVDLPPPPLQPCAPTNLQPTGLGSATTQSNKYDPFRIPKEATMDILQHPVPQIPTLTNPAYAPQNTFVKNVPLDPITQHIDLRMKPKVYESLIKPVPVDVQLQGTLPPYDIDKLWNEYNWEQPEESVLSQRKPLFKHIPDYQIFRAHIPKAAELKKIYETLKIKSDT